MTHGHETEMAAVEARDTVHDLPKLSEPIIADSPQSLPELRERLVGLNTEVGAALSGSGALRDTLARCTTALVRRLSVAQGRIWTLERGEQVLVLQASSGEHTRLDGRYSRVAVGRLKVGMVAQTAHPYLTNDLANDPRPEDREWARHEGMLSCASHPLVADGRVVGVLAVFDREPLPATALDELAFIADGIAQFIERQRIERERAVLLEREREARTRAEEAVRRAAFLARASLALDSSLDHRSALEQVASLLVPSLADWCLIDVIEEGGIVCRFMAAETGSESNERRVAHDALQSPLLKLALQTGEAILFPECTKIQALLGPCVSEAVKTCDEARSLMAVPLCARGHLFGVIVLVSTTPERRYTELDLSLAEDFAQRCSLTLDTIRLVARAQSEVAERRWAEAALLRSEEHLRQVQKMDAIGRLAGGIAHDFNNLLTGILGYSELLLQALPAGAERDVAYSIRQIGERAALLTGQLLMFSRKRTSPPERVNLNSLIDNLGGMLRRLIRADIELVTAVEPALGPVRIDPGQLEQVIVNLVVNARDAMPQPGRLTIAARNIGLDASWRHPDVQPGPHVLIEVSDTGMGITDEVRVHLFEPFFTTKPIGEGQVGLAIIYGIVQHAGGFIDVQSEPGQGARFQIYLPQIVEPLTESGKHEDHGLRAPHFSLRGEQGTETVLLAEDDEVIRGLVSMALRAVGYTVLEAAHGVEALRQASGSRRIDLLVTDVIMPRMGGRELAERLWEARPGLKVLYMSAHADNAVVHALQGSGSELLEKPFRLEALIRKVRQLLDAAATDGIPVLPPS